MKSEHLIEKWFRFKKDVFDTNKDWEDAMKEFLEIYGKKATDDELQGFKFGRVESAKIVIDEFILQRRRDLLKLWAEY